MATGVAWEGPNPGDKTTETVLRLYVKTVASGPTNPERSAGPSTKSAFTVEDSDISQECADRIQTTSIVTRLKSNT